MLSETVREVTGSPPVMSSVNFLANSCHTHVVAHLHHTGGMEPLPAVDAALIERYWRYIEEPDMTSAISQPTIDAPFACDLAVALHPSADGVAIALPFED